MITQQSIDAKTAAVSVASGVSSFVFGLPIAVVLAAFAGACLSLSLAGPRKFIGALGYVLSGTITSAFCTPLALYFAKTLPERPVAFIIGFAVMHTLPPIVDVLKTLPKELKDKWLSR